MNNGVTINPTLIQDTIIFLKYISSSAEDEVIKDTAQKFLNSYNLVAKNLDSTQSNFWERV